MTKIYSLRNGINVDVKLTERPRHYPCFTQGGSVYWGSKEQNTPSYVLADSRDTLEGMSYREKRAFFYHPESDSYVRLISVNGGGENRWGVDTFSFYGAADEDAARAFGLVD